MGTHLTAAESETLAPFIWGGWIGVAKGREKEYADGLRAVVEHILTDRLAEQREQIAKAIEAEYTAEVARLTTPERPDPHKVPLLHNWLCGLREGARIIAPDDSGEADWSLAVALTCVLGIVLVLAAGWVW